jgi:hypothetical protein
MQSVKATAIFLVVLSAGCWVKPVTREDRAAVSEAIASREEGTITTDRELSMADQDETVICTDEITVGTHIPTKTCRTARRVEEEKEASQKIQNTTRGSTLRPEAR